MPTWIRQARPDHASYPGMLMKVQTVPGSLICSPPWPSAAISPNTALKRCSIPSGWSFPHHPLRQRILPRQVDAGVLAGQQQLDADVIDAGGL